jgi:predicted dehydrogenase
VNPDNEQPTSELSSRKLRHVIIGVGAGVLGMHRPGLELDAVTVVGASDINAPLGQARADELSCPFFTDYQEMLRTTKPDVAVILAPHPFHATLAIDCLNAGAHVLVEKPMAVQIKEADAMIVAAQRNKRLLAVSFQQRFRPEVRAAHELLQAGQLGDLQHVTMHANWFRTRAYFQSASWRATWRGEGGGVLMNQGIHDLDVLCYLLGFPKRLTAWTRTRLHATEVEDTAQAMLEWENGCLGSFHTSTAEAGRKDYLELEGTKGTLRVTPGELSGNVFDTPLEQFILESDIPWAQPGMKTLEVKLRADQGDHTAVYTHFHEALVQGRPLLSSGEEARKSLELANAMIYSSHKHQSVELPLDSDLYSELLEDLKRGSVR